MGGGQAFQREGWSFWPRIYPDQYPADHTRSFFWRRHVPLLVSFSLFTLLPSARQWTGLAPAICVPALLIHASVFGSEVHFRISRVMGLTGYTSFVLTTNFLVVAAICASPGRFVPTVWPLYFVYLTIPLIGSSRSIYVVMLAMLSPLLAGAAWNTLGTSLWKDSAVLLGIVSALAGFSYILLKNYSVKLREERLLLEQERLKRAREEQKLAIADDLHDTLGIALAEAALWQGIGKKAAGEDGQAALDRAEKRLQDAVQELRAAVATLSDKEVLQASVEKLIRARIGSLCEASGVALDIQCEGAKGSIDGNRAHQLVKFAEEAVSNAIRHGKPTKLSLHLSWEGSPRLLIHDDGEGFELSFVKEGHGLSSLKRRAELLGASLDIQSTAGLGTTVALRAR